jgi:hypothetical protein
MAWSYLTTTGAIIPVCRQPRFHVLQKNPNRAIYLHLMQIIFQICLRSDFLHVRMHLLAQPEQQPQQRPQGFTVKTTTQQQMTTQRPARGLSLLACSLLASLQVALLAAAQQARRALPTPDYHQHQHWLAFDGAYDKPRNNIRGGNP